jgi:D-alanyl-D-alanine carboxypeptidase
MFATRRALLGGFAALPLVSAFPAMARTRRDETAAGAALDAVFAEAAPPALAAGIVTREGLDWSGVRGVRRVRKRDPGDHRRPLAPGVEHQGDDRRRLRADWSTRAAPAGPCRSVRPFRALTVDPAWAAITLDDLMHHRAGLLDAALLDRAWLMAAHADQRPLPEQRAEFAARALGAPPAGPVGQFAYGNGNYIVLGAAIETITGQPWETVMAAELYAPLGLTTAGFGAPQDPAPWGHRSGVGVDPAGFADNPRALGPAGTAHMSMADYARFIGAMMGGKPGWLSEDARGHLLTPAAGSPRRPMQPAGA